MFHDFDGKTLDLKTFGIMAKLDQLKNHCWLAVANLILDRLKTLVSATSTQMYARYLRLDFQTRISKKQLRNHFYENQAK